MRLALGLGLALLCIVGSDAALAAMSIDLGSQFIKVGLVKPGVPMEIVLNKESRRKTPNVLSIRNGDRLFGDAALAVKARYPTSVYGNLLDLVGKSIDHPSVQLFQKRFPHLALEKHANDSSIVIPFGEEKYTVETLLAMILSNAREFTEVYAEQPVKDVVITVPVYFTQVERLAIEKAAQIAGLNLLQLVNDGTAVGLNYGVFRRKEITETPQKLLVFDMGASKTTATVLEFKLVKEKYGKEPKMKVLGVGYDRTLGGLEITLRLVDYLVEKFRHHYKSEKDITTNQRGMAKMFKEAERVKQVLSANAHTFAQIESVHEDKDMRIEITRKELTDLIHDFDDRVKAPIEQALKMAEIRITDVDQVVMMGAGTRVPKVQELLQAAVEGKELGRFLNTDESAAMGALFQAAHLSKGFKVKPFNVEDLVVYPVQVNFVSKQKQENGEILNKQITRQIFQYKTTYPSKKKSISFTSYTEDFNFDITYGELTHFNPEQIKELHELSPSLASISVSGLTKTLEEKVQPENNEFKGVKVGFRMDESGIIRISKAEVSIETKHKGVVDSKIISDGKGVMRSITDTLSSFFSHPKEEGEPTESEGTDAESAEKADDTKVKEDSSAETQQEETEKQSDAPSTEEKAEETKPESSSEPSDGEQKESEKTEEKKEDTNASKKNATETKKEKVADVVTVSLKTEASYASTRVLSKADVNEYRSVLEAFERKEKLAAERAAAENELEAFAFEASLQLDEEKFIQFSAEEERQKLDVEVKRIRAWLEDDTTPETKTGEFKENLKTLKDLVRPAKRRISESEKRPEFISNLENMINSSMVFVKMGGDDEKALFPKKDADKFGEMLSKLSKWLDEKKAAQAEKKDNENPAVTVKQIQEKIKSLDNELKSFMRKMKKERTVNLNKEDLDKEKDKKTADSKEPIVEDMFKDLPKEESEPSTPEDPVSEKPDEGEKDAAKTEL